MKTFDGDIINLREYIESKFKSGRNVKYMALSNEDKKQVDFINKGTYSIVLKEDTCVELGSPKMFSMAPVLVTERPDLVNDGTITLIGPDIQETRGIIPFAQILLLQSAELKDEDYRGLNSFQYELNLEGYMIKALPSSLSIWSRVSKDSVQKGFSFGILGKELLNFYKTKFNIQSAEIIFITSSEKDVKELESLSLLYEN